MKKTDHKQAINALSPRPFSFQSPDEPVSHEQQEEWETIISFNAKKWEKKLARKNFSSPAHTNLLRQAALSGALRLQNLKIPERLASSLEALKAAIRTLPLSKKDKQAPVSEVLKRVAEMDAQTPAIRRFQACVREVRFWALGQAISDHALTANKAAIQERLDKGDIKALSEYIEAKIQADETADAREVKINRALQEVRTEEESITAQVLKIVFQMHPPAVDKGRKALPHDMGVQNVLESNRKSQRSIRARRYCGEFFTDYQQRTAALPSADYQTRRQVANAIAHDESLRGGPAKQEGVRLFLQKVERMLTAQKG